MLRKRRFLSVEAGRVERRLGLPRGAALGASAADLLRRPEVRVGPMVEALKDCLGEGSPEARAMAAVLAAGDGVSLEADLKYEGYVRRQMERIGRMQAFERIKIPEWVFDDPPPALSVEARQKIKLHRPATLGQALRIAGVTPADVDVLSVLIRGRR